MITANQNRFMFSTMYLKSTLPYPHNSHNLDSIQFITTCHAMVSSTRVTQWSHCHVSHHGLITTSHAMVLLLHVTPRAHCHMSHHSLTTISLAMISSPHITMLSHIYMQHRSLITVCHAVDSSPPITPEAHYHESCCGLMVWIYWEDGEWGVCEESVDLKSRGRPLGKWRERVKVYMQERGATRGTGLNQTRRGCSDSQRWRLFYWGHSLGNVPGGSEASELKRDT